jgi:hypothetical protein
VKRWLPVAFVAALGCSRAVTVPVTVTQKSELPTVRTLAVVPAVAAPSISGDAAARAPGAVTAMVANAAKEAGMWTVVDASKVQAADKSVPAADVESRAGAIAANVGADAALAAVVRRYDERKGSEYGASDPAAVSLVVMLVPSGAKQAVWRGDYTFQQVPLTYNLWNFWAFQRGGLRWQTVDELTTIGIDEAVKRLAASVPPP